MKAGKNSKAPGTVITQRKVPDPVPSLEQSNGKVKGGEDKTSSREDSIKEMERREREKIVLWRAPFTTLRYFLAESAILLYSLCERFVHLFEISLKSETKD